MVISSEFTVNATTLGVTLRELRESYVWTDGEGDLCIGMTQADLGSMVGVTQKAISHWEVGRTIPSIRNLLRVAEVFGVPAAELLVSAE